MWVCVAVVLVTMTLIVMEFPTVSITVQQTLESAHLEYVVATCLTKMWMVTVSLTVMINVQMNFHLDTPLSQLTSMKPLSQPREESTGYAGVQQTLFALRLQISEWTLVSSC
jgi:hypothetical protein